MSNEDFDFIRESVLPEIDESTELLIPYGRPTPYERNGPARLLLYALFFICVIPSVLTIALAWTAPLALEWLTWLFFATGGIYVTLRSALHCLESPTQVFIGKQGLKLYWLSTGSLIVSPLFSWSAITHVGLTEKERNGSKDQTICVHFDKKQLPAIIRMLFQLASHGGACLHFPLDHIPHKDDVSQFVSQLRNYLDEAQFDERVLALVQTNKVPTFTMLWLDKLSEAVNGVSPLEPKSVLAGKNRRYEIIERIGSGGQGLTYLADAERDGSSEGEVVLKEFILPVSGGIEITHKAIENIKKEADLIKSLDHPQIVRCLDYFTSGRRAYIVMNVINGRTLRQVVEDDGPIAEEAALELAEQMVHILTYLHSKQPPVVHRDFTPDNLMLRDDGKLVLIDFNVAKRIESQTATQTVVGRHCYIPPEQFQGRSSPASDIYALGGTLFFCATGEDPEPLTASKLPDANRSTDAQTLANIIAKATAQKIEKRYACAAEITADLAHSTERNASHT